MHAGDRKVSGALREATVCRQSVPGRSGKPLSAVSPFPDAPGSRCLLSVRSRTLREATVCCQSVPGRSGKPLSAVSLFPEVPGSHCLLSVGRRTLRKAVQFAAGQGFSPGWHPGKSMSIRPSFS
ncbi:MAG: hypothetical protein LBL07_17530 [Tannerella sp.]|nr:hypothetical protein [Tannerella sp.]